MDINDLIAWADGLFESGLPSDPDLDVAIWAYLGGSGLSPPFTSSLDAARKLADRDGFTWSIGTLSGYANVWRYVYRKGALANEVEFWGNYGTRGGEALSLVRAALKCIREVGTKGLSL